MRLKKIHSKLAEIINTSRKIIPTGNDEIYIEFNNAVAEFRNVFEIEKLWLDASISQEIESFAIEVDKQVRLYQGATFISRLPNLSDTQATKVFDRYDEFYKFTISTSTLLKNKLELSLRSYLSPNYTSL
ncbi:hypothetical protein ABLF39_000855 [Aeromonas hydrophila]